MLCLRGELTVGADKRVNSAQVVTVVQGVTTTFSLDGDTKTAGFVVEKVGVVGSGQGLEELSHGLGETVVRLVHGGPHRVTTSLGKGVDLESSIV